MNAFVLFEKTIILALQKALFYFCTVNIFLYIGKNVLIIGIKLPIINTFWHINQKIFKVQKQKSAFWNAKVVGFSKIIKTFR